MEFKPEDVLRNRIHFSALLTSGDDVSVTVTVGGVDIAGAAFTRKPDGGVGVYQYVFPFPFLKPSNCLGRGYLTKVSSNPNLCQWKRRYKRLDRSRGGNNEPRWNYHRNRVRRPRHHTRMRTGRTKLQRLGRG